MKYKFVSVFFSQRRTGHVKLTTKSSRIIPALRHFYALRESWARRIEYINSWGRSSKINRAVTIFNFNRWITDSPMQITIHEIKAFHFNDRTVNCTIYFAFLCKPIWGNTSVSRYYCNLLPFPLSWHLLGNGVPQKYLEERRPPRFAFPLDYTTCDGCYFQIQKLQYLCDAHEHEQTFEVIGYLSNKTANIKW